jgi:membrane-associated phospholipid phosphatase
VRGVHVALFALSLIVWSARARAEPAVVRADPLVDGIALGAALGGTLALSRLPVRASLWTHELLPFDDAVRGTFSALDGAVSNVTLVATIAVPMAVEAARGRASVLPAAAVCGEALAVGLLFDSVAKYTVGRPRPYVYSRDPAARAHARDEGDDAYLSFYSGHATSAFAAAVAGSLIFSYGEPNPTPRAVMWGTEMALASSTAVLRVRAGKHFPSDVLFGALVGTATGILVTRAHATARDAYSPSPEEWGAMGAGLALGATVTSLAPRAIGSRMASARVSLLPLVTPSGAGFALRWGDL